MRYYRSLIDLLEINVFRNTTNRAVIGMIELLKKIGKLEILK